MGRALGRTAEAVGCSERTLRRYVNEGLLRGRRVRGQLELTAQEERYLHLHHPLIRRLRAALRTERDVRLAVLFGSVALGEERVDSDVDVLVAHRRIDPFVAGGLAVRLGRAVGKPVHVIRLEDAEQSPSLLADALVEGRVLVDRDGRWVRLLARQPEVLAAAEREEAESLASARKAVEEARARLAG